MKAAVCYRAGSPDVVQLAEIPRPAVPDDGVLVRVQAASVNPVDAYQLSGMAYVTRLLAGRLRPSPAVLGTDFAGTVEAVGRGVTQLQPGDAVFGAQRGAFAEYVCLPAHGPVVRKPANVTFEQAAAVPVAAITALQAVRDHGRLQPGQKVLVNGASGGVGTFAVQIARAFGGEVTAVCSTRNVDTVRSIGAQRVIDYTREDFVRTLGGQNYDLLLDVAGSRSWSECTRVLAPRATFVIVGAAAVQYTSAWRGLSRLAGVRLASLGSRHRVALFIARLNQADIVVLQDLLEAGQLRPVIDRCYPLGDVAAAFRYLAQGHAQGKILIDLASA